MHKPKIPIIMAALPLAALLSSCSAVRTITTTATTERDGDKTTTITTKTIEQYDGRKQ